MILRFGCLFLFFLFTCTLFAQEDSISTKPVISVLPLVYYTPETSWSFGVGAVGNFKIGNPLLETYKSQIALGGAYTLFNQFLAYGSWRVFTTENKQLFAGEIGWYRYVYFFYGIGPNVQEIDRERFDATFPRLRFDYLRKLRTNLYLGLRYHFDDFEITSIEEGGILDNQNIRGREGGRISGLGPMIYYDSRDSQIYPTKGFFAEASFQTFHNSIGSEFNFNRWLVDFRSVHSIRKKSVFVWNVYGEFITGQPPFFGLPLVGGNRLLRGLFEGKFRDERLALVQAEYRWRFLPRWGAAAFSGIGNVFSKENLFQIDQSKFTYGIGGRFQLSKKEKLNLRLDIASSPNEDLRIYLTFGEAF
ncbi:outer membrane protein [Belliella baltica DSM 15883]|uniref:Outer membrane protein n=1 Tax=Belliella baltica (strain DSM 15883 / CIP 108006 / LMG 21964 / BA134) TaxID=866536 RepID=I3Z698_BELBD|nr:BamA/TamA family outer membrane protein [Belliella baltica]AFL84766.1 outer membrane protein [Belliella baltica DSM 15883]